MDTKEFTFVITQFASIKRCWASPRLYFCRVAAGRPDGSTGIKSLKLGPT